MEEERRLADMARDMEQRQKELEGELSRARAQKEQAQQTRRTQEGMLAAMRQKRDEGLLRDTSVSHSIAVSPSIAHLEPLTHTAWQSHDGPLRSVTTFRSGPLSSALP